MGEVIVGQIVSNANLWSLRERQGCVITGFDSKLISRYKVRLMELGFHEGEFVSCIKAPKLGAPKVYRVSNTVFALDEDLADKIFIGT